MEQHINTFDGGLDTDITKSKINQSKYRDACNIRLVSGGIDSTLMSILAKEQNFELYPLFID